MTLSRLSSAAALAACLLGSAGCSLAEATDGEQCTVDADCAARGAAFAGTVCTDNTCQAKPDPKWGCIGSVAALKSGGMVPFKIQLLDLVSNGPIASGLTVKLCSKLDPTCATPLGSPVADAMGFVGATVASDFDGYLDITDSNSTYLPALIFIDVVAIAQNSQILLIPKNAEAGLAMNAMVPLDPTGAALLVQTVDCTAARTAGVSVSMSPQGSETGFYVINNSLLPTATETDGSGNAGFVNVTAPETVTVTGTVGPGGKELGKTTTLVRAGGMTYQLLRPTTPP